MLKIISIAFGFHPIYKLPTTNPRPPPLPPILIFACHAHIPPPRFVHTGIIARYRDDLTCACARVQSNGGRVKQTARSRGRAALEGIDSRSPPGRVADGTGVMGARAPSLCREAGPVKIGLERAGPFPRTPTPGPGNGRPTDPVPGRRPRDPH